MKKSKHGNVSNLPAQLLVNSLAFSRLIEETLLSTVPGTVTAASMSECMGINVDFNSIPYFNSLLKTFAWQEDLRMVPSGCRTPVTELFWLARLKMQLE